MWVELLYATKKGEGWHHLRSPVSTSYSARSSNFRVAACLIVFFQLLLSHARFAAYL